MFPAVMQTNRFSSVSGTLTWTAEQAWKATRKQSPAFVSDLMVFIKNNTGEALRAQVSLNGDDDILNNWDKIAGLWEPTSGYEIAAGAKHFLCARRFSGGGVFFKIPGLDGIPPRHYVNIQFYPENAATGTLDYKYFWQPARPGERNNLVSDFTPMSAITDQVLSSATSYNPPAGADRMMIMALGGDVWYSLDANLETASENGSFRVTEDDGVMILPVQRGKAVSLLAPSPGKVVFQWGR